MLLVSYAFKSEEFKSIGDSNNQCSYFFYCTILKYQEKQARRLKIKDFKKHYAPFGCA